MNNEELIRIAAVAREVRRCQREYFKTRSREALAASKNAEIELDYLLTKLYDNKPQGEQQELL